jgi:dienelactone hydrolase
MHRLLAVLVSCAVLTSHADEQNARYVAHRQFDELVPACKFQAHWDGDDVLNYRQAGVPRRLNVLTGADNPADPAPARDEQRQFIRETWFGVQLPVSELLAPRDARTAYVDGGNVWIRPGSSGTPARLTADGTREIQWDIGPFPADSWSPDGSLLFAIRYDRSQVMRAPQVNYLGPHEQLTMVLAHKAGTPIDLGAPHLLPTDGHPPIALDVGDTRDKYFALLGWTNDGSEVLFAKFSRAFDRVDVLAASRTGRVRTLFSETSSSFVRIQHLIIFSVDYGFRLLPDGAGFLWQSERDGWNHLYRYDLRGKLVRQLTKGPYRVHDVVRVDEKSGRVYFTASKEAHAYDRHLYSVALEGGPVTRLTEGRGRHDIQFSPDGRLFLDDYSSVAEPPRREIRRADGTLVHAFPRADLTALRNLGWTPPEEIIVKAADGQTDLYGVLFKPGDFDPTKRYPLIEYVYGGPQFRQTPDEFCTGHGWASVPPALAQLGYLVLMVDGRGTPGRSKAFHDAVMGDWAGHVVADHAAALKQLIAARPYIDSDRIGVMGRSWGGHFALRFLAEAPKIYRAAVSIVPSFDARAGILYEPYLGMPQENSAAYDEASAFRLAPRVHGPLLLVGGVLDSSTLVDVMKMSQSLIDAEKQFDLLLFPAQEHPILDHDMDYLADRVVRFFERSLAPK